MEGQPTVMTASIPDSDRSEASHPRTGVAGNIRQKAPNGQPISGCGRFAGMLNRG
jgi:hypothetical protein